MTDAETTGGISGRELVTGSLALLGVTGVDATSAPDEPMLRRVRRLVGVPPKPVRPVSARLDTANGKVRGYVAGGIHTATSRLRLNPT